MYGHIFDVKDWWTSAEAASQLSRLQIASQGRLTNLLVKIESIGDPYYMDLNPRTYMATIR